MRSLHGVAKAGTLAAAEKNLTFARDSLLRAATLNLTVRNGFMVVEKGVHLSVESDLLLLGVKLL